MTKTFCKNLLLILAFAVGILIPKAADFIWMIQYLIITMLFISYAKMNHPWHRLSLIHFKIIAVSIILALTFWGGLSILNMPRLAETAFYISITPTAAAAPVIVGLLDGDSEFTAVSVCLSNLAAAIILPLLLNLIGGDKITLMVCLHSLVSVSKVVILPAILALLLKFLWKDAPAAIDKISWINFYLWIGVLVLAAAKSSSYLKSTHQSLKILVSIAALSVFICIICFTAGRIIGRKNHALECSQALGQKNTTLTIYFSMLYADPAVTLGLTFYVFWHNTWNAMQLQSHSWKKTENPIIHEKLRKKTSTLSK